MCDLQGITNGLTCQFRYVVLIAEMKKEIAEIKAGEKATNQG